MRDNTDKSITGRQMVQYVKRFIQHIRTESSKTFIDEQRIQLFFARVHLHYIG